MKPEELKTQADKGEVPAGSAAADARKPYSPPRLRSLGRVNEITGGLTGEQPSMKKKKPQG
jgi:hypothetical protein